MSRAADPQSDDGRPRFAQLTYSSVNPGGWQVLGVGGGITPLEEHFLVAEIDILDTQALNLPRFPTSAEVAAQPRRLTYAPASERSAAYWHTASAGLDWAGRPGNVFAHVVLDRGPSLLALPLRPSDLLLSPNWLRPIGEVAVREATLKDVQPPPWKPALDRAAVLDFVMEAALLQPVVLSVLLDAIHAAMAEPAQGPPVVLVADDAFRGSCWIAAVCHLMSPGTSRRLYWSNHWRASTLDRLLGRGVHLVVMPPSELNALRGIDGITLVVENEEAALGDWPSSPHLTPSGSVVPASPYSALAIGVLQNRSVAERVLALQDTVAAEVGDWDLPVGWPLALAALTVEQPDLIYLEREARALLADSAHTPHLPPSLQRQLTLIDAGAWSRTTAGAFDAITAHRGSPIADLAFNAYFEKAINDREWIVEEEPRRPRPSIASSALPPELVDRAVEALDRMTDEAGGGEDRLASAAYALRLADFIVGIGLMDVPNHGHLAHAVRQSLDGLVGPLLLDLVHGPELVVTTGPLADQALRTHVRPWIDAHLDALRRPPGKQLPPSVLAWLYPEPPAPATVDALEDSSTAIPPTLVEYAAHGLPGPPSLGRIWGGLVTRCPHCFDLIFRRAATECTHCHLELPSGWHQAGSTCIAVVGPRYAGKTIFTGVMVKQLEQWGSQQGIDVCASSPGTEQIFSAHYEDPLYRERGIARLVRSWDTPAPTGIAYTLTTPSGRVHHLALRKVDSEFLRTRTRSPVSIDVVHQADYVFFLVDPFQIKAVRDTVRDFLPGIGVDHETESISTLGRLLNTIGSASARIGIVLTKFDALQGLRGLPDDNEWGLIMRNPGAAIVRDPGPSAGVDPDGGDLLHHEVRSLLIKLGAGEFVAMVEQGAQHRFFAVSALGAPLTGEDLRSRGIAPFRCLDPLRWALRDAGVLD